MRGRDKNRPGARRRDRYKAARAIRAIAPTERTSSGDLWLLGRHRLLCGDATDQRAVARVLDGHQPPLMVTDPPYGVSYEPSWRSVLDNDERPNRATGLVVNDDRHDWTAAYRLFPGAIAYVWHSGLHGADVAGHLHAARFGIRNQIIWRKRQLVISRGHYHWQHEPCWYAVRKGQTAEWAGDRKQRTVWDIAPGHDDRRTIHSAQKPIECMAKPMRNHGRADGDAK